jgi:protein-tyrosine phosphatase
MAQRSHKTVLFLCTGNYYRSRFAESLFNSVAGRMGLPWRATSRGLALERGVNNVGPMAASAVRALEALGVCAGDDCARAPAQVTAEDFGAADWVVALKRDEHLPLLRERFPAWAEKVEFWHVDDASEVLHHIEREVMDLAARLIGGGKRREAQEMATETAAPPAKTEVIRTSAPVVRLGRATKGRRGKGVTTVSDVPLDEAGLLELATKLKDRCGTGGTVRDGVIEIQGDQRDRLTAVLEGMGYRVKRAGG